MPYVSADTKKEFEQYELPLYPVSIGVLNYMITRLLLQYAETHRESYETLNAIMGAVESAKLEFYRRVVVPYEKAKIIENGDCYPNKVEKV